ncbi:MAG: hypothetical protein KAH57_01770 [Thermoplasmata archaeon]|nr:hypothetical protein [Thermoplasmata archaeon]
MENKCRKCGANTDKLSIIFRSYDSLSCSTCRSHGCSKCFIKNIDSDELLFYDLKGNHYHFCSIKCAAKFAFIHKTIRDNVDLRVKKDIKGIEKIHNNNIRKVRNTYKIFPYDIKKILNNFIFKYPDIVEKIVVKDNRLLLDMNIKVYENEKLKDLLEILNYSGFSFSVAELATIIKLTYHDQIIDEYSRYLPDECKDLDGALRILIDKKLIAQTEMSSYHSKLRLLILRDLMLKKYGFKITEASLLKLIKKMNILTKKEKLLNFKREEEIIPEAEEILDLNVIETLEEFETFEEDMGGDYNSALVSIKNEISEKTPTYLKDVIQIGPIDNHTQYGPKEIRQIDPKRVKKKVKILNSRSSRVGDVNLKVIKIEKKVKRKILRPTFIEKQKKVIHSRKHILDLLENRKNENNEGVHVNVDEIMLKQNNSVRLKKGESTKKVDVVPNEE